MGGATRWCVGNTDRMTSVPDAATGRPKKQTAEVVRALGQLRSGGHRVTGARIAVIETLARLDGHPSAEELWSALEHRHPGVHRATVYRTLETLADLGVVTHVHMSHGTTAYHLTGLVAGREHLHARCRVCGRVFDLPGNLLDPVRRRLARENDFNLDPHHVALSGTCLTCDD